MLVNSYLILLKLYLCETYNGALTIYGVIQFISPMPFPENKTYHKKAFLTSGCLNFREQTKWQLKRTKYLDMITFLPQKTQYPALN